MQCRQSIGTQRKASGEADEQEPNAWRTPGKGGKQSQHREAKIKSALWRPKASKGCIPSLFWVRLELDDPALEPDHRGVRTVLGAQLRQNAADLAFDGLFA